MIPISLCGASASAKPRDRSLFMLHGAGHVRPVARAPPRSGLLRQYEGITALKRGLELPASARSTEAPKNSDTAAEEVTDDLQAGKENAEGRMLRSLRAVFAAQSVTPTVVANIMSKAGRSFGVIPDGTGYMSAQVDSKGDGVVDLEELTTALSKWMALVAYPGSRDLIHPFATARDIALDFYIAMKQDPRKGLTAAGLQSVLQTLCQATRSSYDVIEDWVEATLLLPDLKLSEADTLAALEIDAALEAKGPELMNGLLQRRELALVFRLWDPQGHGRVNRAAVAAVLEYFYRSYVVPLHQKPAGEGTADAPSLNIPFESQVPKSPASHPEANLQAPKDQKSSTAGQETDGESKPGSSAGPAQPHQAAASTSEMNSTAKQQQNNDSSQLKDSVLHARMTAKISYTGLHVLQAGGQDDSDDSDDPVIAFLEAEMRKDPAGLEPSGFQDLVTRFSQLTDVPQKQAYDFLLEVALHGAIYTGPDPEATIAYLRDQAEDALET